MSGPENDGTRTIGDDGTPSSVGHADSADALIPMTPNEWHLRPKHIETLSLMAEGLSNKQIADRMGITVGTVKTHVSEIFRRMNVERRGEAIVLARRLIEVRDQQFDSAARGETLVNLLMSNAVCREFPEGRILFKKDEIATELYYIKSGVVSMVELNLDLTDGDVFGELGLFSTLRRRSATALCKTNVTAFVMAEKQVRDLHYNNPQFAWFLASTVATRICKDRL